jgi:hypothetical protein
MRVVRSEFDRQPSNRAADQARKSFERQFAPVQGIAFEKS